MTTPTPDPTLTEYRQIILDLTRRLLLARPGDADALLTAGVLMQAAEDYARHLVSLPPNSGHAGTEETK